MEKHRWRLGSGCWAELSIEGVMGERELGRLRDYVQLLDAAVARVLDALPHSAGLAASEAQRRAEPEPVASETKPVLSAGRRCSSCDASSRPLVLCGRCEACCKRADHRAPDPPPSEAQRRAEPEPATKYVAELSGTWERGREAGRGEERADVVAWLREVDVAQRRNERRGDAEIRELAGEYAIDIERDEHAGAAERARAKGRGE
jgi:hypothetical protein